jgi:hypothetical protein
MALSRNEQIALFVVVFLVVTLAGFFLFILPAWNEIEPEREKLEQKQKEYTDAQADLGTEAFAKVAADIMDAYRIGVSASEVFYEDEFTDYEADRLVRAVLAGVENEERGIPALANLPLDNLTINRLATSPLALNLFTPANVVYNIKDLATIGQLEREGEEAPSGTSFSAMQRQLAGANRTRGLQLYREWLASAEHNNMDVVRAMKHFLATQNTVVLAQVVSFDIPLDLAEANALSMHVFNLPNATYIRSMRRGNAVGGQVMGVSLNEVAGETADDPTTDEPTTDDPPPVANVPPPEDGTFMYTIEMLFYIVETMQEPSDEGFEFLSFPQ